MGTPRPQQTPGVLLEREPLLGALRDAVGTGRIALVAGEAGIGKTALVRAFARRLPRSSPALWGACDPLNTPRPLGPLYDLAGADGVGTLADLLAAGAQRERIFGAFLDRLRAATAVIVFEDAHWADEATLDLLRFVGRRMERLRGLLIVTYRSDETGPDHPLRVTLGLLPRAVTLRLQVPPLSEDAVAQLATRAGRVPGGLHAVTAGNPFFVTAVLAAPQGGVPVTVRDAVLARVAPLPASARALLDLMSVVPGRVEHWLLAAAGWEPGQDAVKQSAGMLREDAEGLAFRHELARLAVAEELPARRARELHRAVLSAMRNRGAAPLARLAHHAAGAGDVEGVLQYAPAAARQAEAVGAHREAAAHYAAALRHAGSLEPAERADLLESRSFQCYLTDQIHEAFEARQQALAIWTRIGERVRAGECLRWLSRLSWFRGRRSEAERYGREAIECLEALPPDPALAMAYSNRAQLEMLAGRTPGAVEWGARAITLAERLTQVEPLVHALNNVGTVRLEEGDGGGRLQLERSLQLALEHGMEEHAARAYTNLGSASAQSREYPAAARYLQEGIAYCREHDLDSWTLYMTGWRALVRLDQGEWDGSALDAEFVLGHPRCSPVSRIQALIAIGLLRARRGDPESASVLDEAARLATEAGEPQRICPVAAARAEAAWLRGDLAAIRQEAGRARELAASVKQAWWEGDLDDWLRRSGMAGSPSAVPPPYAAARDGDWQRAAQFWNQLGCPYREALALAQGEDPAAHRAALALLQELGANAAAAAVIRDLRRRGVRGLPRGPRAATRANLGGLTPRQQEVLRLLADGLRDAEIASRLHLSSRTAGHHVSAILAKLGCRNRSEAAEAGRRLGLLPPT